MVDNFISTYTFLHIYNSEHWRRGFFKTGFSQTFVEVQKKCKVIFSHSGVFCRLFTPSPRHFGGNWSQYEHIELLTYTQLEGVLARGLYVNTIKQGGLYVNTSRRCWNGVMTLFRMALTCVLFLVNLFSAKLLKCTGWLLFKVALQPQGVMHKLSFCGSGGGKCSAFCLPCYPCRDFPLHLFCTFSALNLHFICTFSAL